jgi:hypothetical protein
MFLFAPLVMAATLAANTNDTTLGYSATNLVRIAACSVQPQIAYTQSGDDEHTISPEIVGENLNVKFSNTTNKQISAVTFDVTDGNQTKQVVDAGKFSPGILIAHSLELPVSDSDDISCRVSSIAFSDGSTWRMPLAADTTK